MENLTLGAETRALVERMEHVHLSVADADRSIDFYRSAFGMQVRWEDTGSYGRCVHVGTDRFYIAMTEDPGIAPSGESEGAVIFHFGLTTPDLDAFKRHLEASGIEIADEANRREGSAVYLNDPDGHEIEVVGYRGDYRYR